MDFKNRGNVPNVNSRAPWRAAWICRSSSRGSINRYSRFRKAFVLPSRAVRAFVQVTADSRYMLYVNGRFIGRGPARCDPRFLSYDTYDVTSFLRKDANVIGVLVHHYGVGTGAYILGAEGLILQAEISFRSGRHMEIVTDGTWLAKDAGDCWQADVHRINEHQAFREVYDARRETLGWTLPGYDAGRAGGWSPANVLGCPPLGPWKSLVPREIPFERMQYVRPKKLISMGFLKISPRRFQTLSRKDLLEEISWAAVHVPVKTMKKLPVGRPAYFLYDMGRETSAYYRLEIDAPAGITVDIGGSERLSGGYIQPLPDPSAKPAAPRAVDRYITRAGRQTWTNAFNWHGFRYLQVVVNPWSSGIRKLSAGGVHTTADIPDRGFFACSDSLLNKLWKTGKHTVECCLHDGMVDNPWREQQQYIGDGRLDSLFIYYAFGDATLPRNLLRQIAQSQGKLGEIQSGYPWSSNQVITTYCALWITALKEYYLFTGDRQFVRELAPVLRGILKWYRRYLGRDGLLRNVPGWTFVDWVRPPMDGQGRDLQGKASAALNMFYLQGLKDAAWLAREVGITTNSRQYEQRAERLRRAIHRAFWNTRRKCYVDAAGYKAQSDSVSLHVNSLAALLDVAPRESQRSLLSGLLSPKAPVHQPSPYFYFYVFRALAKCGLYKPALEAMRKKWQPMLAAGHQTFWETFVTDVDPGLFPESYCQMWSCAPLYELPAEILGVKPLAPGFRVFEVSPGAIDLRWARGRVPTPCGLIEIAWKKEKKRLSLDLRVPARCVAKVRAPDGTFPCGSAAKRGPSGNAPIECQAGRHRLLFRFGNRR